MAARYIVKRKKKKQKLSLPLFAGLILISLITFGVINLSSRLDWRSRASNSGLGTVIEQEQKLNRTTFDMVRSSKKLNSQSEKVRNDAEFEIVRAAMERKELLYSLAELRPSAVEKYAIPAVLKNQRFSVASHLMEEEVELEGEAEVSIEDDFGENTSRKVFAIKQGDENRTTIHFIGDEPEVMTYDKIKVKGKKIGDRLVVNTNSLDSFEVTGKSNKTLGVSNTLKLAVILLNFQNNTSQPYTHTSALNILYNNTTNVRGFHAENSFNFVTLQGKVQVQGDVFGYYTVPYSPTDCSYSTWSNAAYNMAKSSGADLSGYTNYLYVFPKVSYCSWWGMGTIGSGPGTSWYNGEYRNLVIGHELGHNFGASHANAYNCNTNGSRTAISDSCSIQTYKDPISVMGNMNMRQFNSYHKARTKMLEAYNSQVVTTSGTYSLAPLSTLSNNIQSIRIPREYDSKGNVTKYYYVDYRQPTQYDNFSSTDPIVNGVMIYIAPPDTQYVDSLLLDNESSTTSFTDAALAVGKTFHDPAKNISITTQSVDSTRAVISVQIGQTNPCVQANPDMTISPLAQWGVSGTTQRYTVSITNKDASTCPSSMFAVSSESIPSGWVRTASTSSLSLIPGEKKSYTVDITSPLGAMDNSYTFVERATHSTNSAYTKSVTGTYNVYTEVVITPTPEIPTNTPTSTPPVSLPTATPTPVSVDTTAPSVNITSPLNNAVIKVKSKYQVKVNATDNVKMKNVEIYVNNVLLCTTSTSPYTCIWNVPAKPGVVYTISARAYDSSSNSSTQTIRVTSGR